jgi:hypothetical protein
MSNRFEPGDLVSIRPSKKNYTWVTVEINHDGVETGPWLHASKFADQTGIMIRYLEGENRTHAWCIVFFDNKMYSIGEYLLTAGPARWSGQ